MSGRRRFAGQPEPGGTGIDWGQGEVQRVPKGWKKHREDATTFVDRAVCLECGNDIDVCGHRQR